MSSAQYSSHTSRSPRLKAAAASRTISTFSWDIPRSISLWPAGLPAPRLPGVDGFPTIALPPLFVGISSRWERLNEWGSPPALLRLRGRRTEARGIYHPRYSSGGSPSGVVTERRSLAPGSEHHDAPVCRAAIRRRRLLLSRPAGDRYGIMDRHGTRLAATPDAGRLWRVRRSGPPQAASGTLRPGLRGPPAGALRNRRLGGKPPR